MKRTPLRPILSILLCIPLLLSSFSAVSADEVTDIYTVEDLMNMKNDRSASYRLQADLDLSGVDWVPFAFSGNFDGGGHTLLNLTVSQVGSDIADTVDGNNKTYETHFAGLFSVLRGADIYDLNLLGVDISIQSDDHCFLGALSGFMDSCYISGVTVKEARLTLETSGIMVGVGGLVGFGFGTIENCDVTSTLVFNDTDPSTMCEEFMGGLLSCGNAWIDQCSVTVNGYDSCTGYVHNGGLMGMFYQYNSAHDIGAIYNSEVHGAIHFFEDNPDRRAYCMAYVGEPLTMVDPSGCSFVFEADEIWDYSKPLYPEQCEEPSITTRTISVSCTDEYGFGYTRHTCETCEYSYRDSFTLPQHGETVWSDMSQPQEGVDGLRVLTCQKCGTVLDTEVIPALPIHVHTESEPRITQEATYFQEGTWEVICEECGELLSTGTTPPLTKANQILLSAETLELNYKDTATLSAQLLPSDALNTGYSWSSSNEEVATIDENGNITALGRGTTYITCLSDDTFAASQCEVTVSYTFGQWIIMTILFGWLWY